MAAKKVVKAARKPFNPVPWVLGLLVVATVYLFWIYPGQQPQQPIEVDFAPRTLAK